MYNTRSLTISDEEDDDWDTDALGLEECLFCDRIAKSLEANVKHMTSAHNFFIPDLEYLVDMEGLISYLGMITKPTGAY